MKIKYLLFVFLVVIFTGGLLAEWNGTFYVDVQKGADDCDYPAWTGNVTCSIVLGDYGSQTWMGYGKYSFQLDAPDNGPVDGAVLLQNGYYNCDDLQSVKWTTPPNPPTITVTVWPETY